MIRRHRRRHRPAATDATPGGTNFDAFDIMSMPDKWEYPWFAAWDMAFHCVALAHVDPAFAKYQLVLLCREWFQHPNGALPAYEWDFSDVNPPVQAWAALEVFAIDGARDTRLPQQGVRQAARQLHVVGEPARTTTAPTCSRAASSASTTSGRSTGRTSPSAGTLRAVRRHRVDGVLRAVDGRHRHDPPTFRPAPGDRPRPQVPRALHRRSAGRWTPPACGTTPTGCTTTSSSRPSGEVVPVKVRSMVGIIPLFAAVVLDEYDARSRPHRAARASPA